MRSTVLTLIPALMLLTACDDKPSAGDIEDMLNDSLEQQGASDLFRYKDCEKTNGLEKADKAYVANVTCTIKFYKSSAEIERSNLGGGVGFALMLTQGSFNAGDEKLTQMDVSLVKSEKGWVLDM